MDDVYVDAIYVDDVYCSTACVIYLEIANGLYANVSLLQNGVHASAMGKETDDSEEELEDFIVTQFMDDSEDIGFIYGMFQLAMHIDTYCNRSAYRQVPVGMSGLEWVERKLANR